MASVRSTLNNSGTVTNTYDYEPFGDILSGGGEARQGFNSREKDQEVDLFNNGVRKLDDNEGRFTSIDPLWEKFRSWSPYQYGYNNPLSVTDPKGMQGKKIQTTAEQKPYQDAGAPFNDVAGGGAIGGGGSLKDIVEGLKALFGGAGKQSEADGGSSDLIKPNNLWQQAQNDPSRSNISSTNSSSSNAATSKNSATANDASSGGSSPSFVVTPKGEAIPIPKGATGPTPARNGAGVRFEGGSGGNGLHPNVANVRIMDPTPPRGPSPGYPGGYVNYSNIHGQTVDIVTGKPIGKADPGWHIPLRLPE